MRGSIKKLISLLLILIAITSRKLPIQAHSFNDLNYLSNLISRGIDNYKIDVSLANRKSCSQLSTWNQSNICMKYQNIVEEVCCHALRGDASSMLSFSYGFNTSEEFVKLLNNQLAKIVVYEPERRLLIAINFQYPFSYEDKMTQIFLVKLVDIMNRYPKNILLGTGSNDFILEYDKICFGKGVPQCTDNRKKISNSKIFLQSSAMNPVDKRDVYKRFKNFNVNYGEIEKFCKYGFPNWIHLYPEFPLIFWEPSTEQDIQHVLAQFTSETCMKKHGRNISGMAIATNLDPQMFDIYSKILVQPDTTNPYFSPFTQKFLVQEQKDLRVTKKQRKDSWSIYMVSTNIYSDKNKVFSLYSWQYDPKSQTLNLASTRQHVSLLNQNDSIECLMEDGGDNIILITNNKNNISKPSTIYYFNAKTFDVVMSKQWDKIQTAFMRKNQIVYVTCANDYQYCYIKGTIQFRATQTNITLQLKSVIKKITSIESYGTSFIIVGQSYYNKYLSVALLIDQGRIISPIIPLSLGQNPKIIRKQVGKQYGVLLENAMCHCGVFLNNNGMNKCSFFKQPQFESFRNIHGIVNYLQFNIADILKNDEVISPCHPKVSLSKVFHGINSDIIELPVLGSYLIATEYFRVEEQDIMSSLFCGASNSQRKYVEIEKSSMLTTFSFSGNVAREGYIQQQQ